MKIKISEDGQVCLASSHVPEHALGAYYVPTGQLIWYREDITYVTSIAERANGLIAVSSDKGPPQVLELHTGKTQEILRGLRWISYSPHDESLLVERRGRLQLSYDGGRLATLASGVARQRHLVAWGPREVLVEVLGDGLFCYRITDACCLWSLKSQVSKKEPPLPPGLEHGLGYADRKGLFLAIRSKSLGKGRTTDTSLWVIDSGNGTMFAKHPLTRIGLPVGYDFAMRGSKLLRVTGDVFDISDPAKMICEGRLRDCPS